MHAQGFSSARRGGRRLAVVTALALTGWGAFTPALAADPGNGNGNPPAHSNAPHAAPAGPVAEQPGTGQGNGPANGNAGGQGGGQGDGDKPDKPGKPGPKPGNAGQGQPPAHAGQHGNGHGQPGSPTPPGPPADQPGNGQGDGQGGGKGDGGGETPGAGDPPGNNGTVKITAHGEDDGIPQNTPHVSCLVDIEWYGFDEGPDIVSTVVFEMQAPTSDVAISGTEPSQVFVGGDPASGAGTDSGFDGEATYALSFVGEPHPQQGYHVKLTVHTPGSQGADTKHKVFWFEPCTTTTTPPVVEEEPPAAGGRGNTPAPAVTVTEAGASSQSLSAGEPESGVLGIMAAAPAPAAAVAPLSLPDLVVGKVSTDVPNAVAAGGAGAGATAAADAGWRSALLLQLGLLLFVAAVALRSRRA